MEYDINPLVRLKIYIVNGNSELVMKGMEKLIIVFNKREIANYSQFIEKLNEIFEEYGTVEKITDKEGFKIMELKNLPINNIWDYLSNDNIIHVSLTDKKNKNNKIVRNDSSSLNNSSRKNKKEDNIKSEKNKRNNFSKTSKNKNLIHSSSSSSSSNRYNNKNRYALSSSSSSSSSSNINSPKKNKIYQNHKLEKEKKKYFSSSSSSSFSSSYSKKKNKKKNNEILPNKIYKNDKNYNSLNNKNNKERCDNINLLGKKRKNENNSNNNINFQDKNYFNKNKKNQRKKNKNKNNNNNNIYEKNNNNNIENKNINYELIPSDKLDDIAFLQNSYPKLFNKGTNIKFKAQELLPNGIGVGDYHYGVIDDFNLENKSFLIKQCNSMNEKSLLLMYSYEEDLMCINLKNFVEIWIESENKASEVSEVVNTSNYNIDIDEDLKKKFIKRQIEYYLSDVNYEKDNFLRSKEDENGYIPIDFIMSFNKIKMITTDKDLFVKSLKENENNVGEENQNKLYELNEDLSKIRKVNFMNFRAL